MQKRVIFGKKISNENDIFEALEYCHNKGIQTVIVSSSKSFDDDSLALYASSKSEQKYLLFKFFIFYMKKFHKVIIK